MEKRVSGTTYRVTLPRGATATVAFDADWNGDSVAGGG
jgi:hypothetical protein